MNDLISRSDLLAAYDKAHQGPPGGARKLIEEAPAASPWHVFCEVNEDDENGETWTRLGCNQYPDHGQDILLFEQNFGTCRVDTWDEVEWIENNCTSDGLEILPGDAWMELPEPPEQFLVSQIAERMRRT